MSLILIVFMLPLSAIQAPSDSQPRYSLREVKQRIDSHRRMVRMCGPLSAARAMAIKGKAVDLKSVLSPYDRSDRQGVQVREVIDLCRRAGLRARGIQLRANRCSLDCLPAPSILLINDDQHCIVLEAVQADARTARIWDPSDLRSKTISIDGLDGLWSGKAIVFDPFPVVWPLIDYATLAAAFVTLLLFFGELRLRREC